MSRPPPPAVVRRVLVLAPARAQILSTRARALMGRSPDKPRVMVLRLTAGGRVIAVEHGVEVDNLERLRGGELDGWDAGGERGRLPDDGELSSGVVIRRGRGPG